MTMAEIDTPPTSGPKSPPREVIEFFSAAPGDPLRPRCVGRLRAPSNLGDWLKHTEETSEASECIPFRIATRDGRVLFETEGIQDADDADDGDCVNQRAELEALERRLAERERELQEKEHDLLVLKGQVVTEQATLERTRREATAEQATLERTQRETDEARATLRSEREFLAHERAAMAAERQKLLDQAATDRERILAQIVSDRNALLEQNIAERERLLGDGEALRERARQEAQQRTAELAAVTQANLNALQLVGDTVRQIGGRVHEQTLTMLEGDKAITDVLTARQAEQVVDLQELRNLFREGLPEKPPAPNPKDEMWAQVGMAFAKVLGRVDPNKVGNKLLRVLSEDDPA